MLPKVIINALVAVPQDYESCDVDGRQNKNIHV